MGRSAGPKGPLPSMDASSRLSPSLSRTPTAGPNSPANMFPFTNAPRLPNMGLISTAGSSGIRPRKNCLSPSLGLGISMRWLLTLRRRVLPRAPGVPGPGARTRGAWCVRAGSPDTREVAWRCQPSTGLAGRLDDAEHGPLRIANDRDPADRGIERVGEQRTAVLGDLRGCGVNVVNVEVHMPVIGNTRHLGRGAPGDLLVTHLEQRVLPRTHVHGGGGKAEHLLVEGGGSGVCGDQLVPGEGPWFVHKRGPDVIGGLPQGHGCAPWVEHERHPASVHHVEGLHRDLTTCCADFGYRLVD